MYQVRTYTTKGHKEHNGQIVAAHAPIWQRAMQY